MQEVPRQGEAERFFDSVGDAPRRLLMLDYDGTLAPFRVERDQAMPYPGVREALNELVAAGHTRVVLVSGRSAREIPPLLGLQHPVEVWGSHGAERLLPDGAYTLAPLPRAVQEGFEQAEAWTTAYAIDDRFERKPAAVAVHWRGLSERAAESLRARALDDWQVIASDAGLDVHSFDGGLELRAPGFDKGAVVHTLLAEAGDGVAAAFLGDDLTDEDAFAALDGHGLGVLVRHEHRPTRAGLWLRPPEGLHAFLQLWRQVIERAGPTIG